MIRQMAVRNDYHKLNRLKPMILGQKAHVQAIQDHNLMLSICRFMCVCPFLCRLTHRMQLFVFSFAITKTVKI